LSYAPTLDLTAFIWQKEPWDAERSRHTVVVSVLKQFTQPPESPQP